MKDTNAFNTVEKSYWEFEQSKKTYEKREGQLEERRGYIWKIIGDPPMLKPLRKFINSQWKLFYLGVIAMLFLMLVPVMLNAAYGVIMSGLVIALVLNFIMREQRSERNSHYGFLCRMNKERMRGRSI